MSIRNIVVFPNMQKRNTAVLMEKILSTLHEAGCTVYMQPEYGLSYPKVRPLTQTEGFSHCDLFLTVGGDGTILEYAKQALRAGKPLLGVNAGRLGYLAQVEQDELELLKRLPLGQYKLRSRMLLSVEHAGKPMGYALNEVVIRASHTCLLDVDVYEGDDFLGHYRADGMIVATPTGSTAYSLSCGGPIAAPELDSMILTPICPHSLYGRSLVLRPDVRLMLQGSGNKPQTTAELVIDGEQVCSLSGTGSVAVQRAEQRVSFVSFAEKTFGSIIQKKLRVYE